MCCGDKAIPGFNYRCRDMPKKIVNYCIDPLVISGLERHFIREHIESCSRCRAKLTALQAAIANDLARRERCRPLPQPSPFE